VNGLSVTGDFSQTNNCPATLQPGVGCVITVSFTPTAAGARTGTISVATNAAAGLSAASLQGTGGQPAVTLSATTLFFGVVSNGTSSTAQTIFVNNIGTAPLNVSGVTASGDFSQTNTCNTPVQPQQNCQIVVIFKPTGSGARNGTITVTDDAAGSPRTVNLVGGVAPDFSMAAASGGSTSATIAAGQVATYNLALTSVAGFNGLVSLTCSGVPTNGGCAITPNSIILGSGATVPFTVTVTTVSRTNAVPGQQVSRNMLPRRPSGVGWLAQMLGPLAIVLIGVRNKRTRRKLAVAFAILGLMLAIGCGSSTTTAKGTPAGNYTITITAVQGSITHTQNLTLTVQ
jgi:hypothetical protein